MADALRSPGGPGVAAIGALGCVALGAAAAFGAAFGTALGTGLATGAGGTGGVGAFGALGTGLATDAGGTGTFGGLDVCRFVTDFRTAGFEDPAAAF